MRLLKRREEKRIDYDLCDLKADGLDSLVDALSDLEVNVQSGREKVRVYVEKKFP
jgi:hypothetical protein